MNDFLLKPNEIMIFTDFNQTLVDFSTEYNDYKTILTGCEYVNLPLMIKYRVSKALEEFEKQTGYVPVICIVTNASKYDIDNNNTKGIFEDLHMTFFDHSNRTKEQIEYIYNSSCEKYFRYLVYKENDTFYRINPLEDDFNKMFEEIPFDERSLAIKYIPQFKKLENVDRMMSIIDPERSLTKFAIFAGDDIKDDYPMKLVRTGEGVCKIFIRPGRSKTISPAVKKQFCDAKGDVFTSIHPKSKKLLSVFDDNSINYLNEKDRRTLENFSDGDHVLLTRKNSAGFVEGIYQAIEIIKAAKEAENYKNNNFDLE